MLTISDIVLLFDKVMTLIKKYRQQIFEVESFGQINGIQEILLSNISEHSVIIKQTKGKVQPLKNYVVKPQQQFYVYPKLDTDEGVFIITLCIELTDGSTRKLRLRCKESNKMLQTVDFYRTSLIFNILR